MHIRSISEDERELRFYLESFMTQRSLSSDITNAWKKADEIVKTLESTQSNPYMEPMYKALLEAREKRNPSEFYDYLTGLWGLLV